MSGSDKGKIGKTVAQATSEIFELLQSFEPTDRQRVINAALVLLGEPTTVAGIPLVKAGAAPSAGAASTSTAREFFDTKNPNNKIEELAVAARYAEQREQKETHTKEEIEVIVKAARRNFDTKNFKRDLGNAKTKGLFNKGDEITLAYYGQQYVDTLPDRETLKSLRAPKGAKRKSKKSAKKKPAIK